MNGLYYEVTAMHMCPKRCSFKFLFMENDMQYSSTTTEEIVVVILYNIIMIRKIQRVHLATGDSLLSIKLLHLLVERIPPCL